MSRLPFSLLAFSVPFGYLSIPAKVFYLAWKVLEYCLMNVGDLHKFLDPYDDTAPVSVVAVAEERRWASQTILADQHNSGTALANRGPALVVYEKPEYVPDGGPPDHYNEKES